MNKTRWLSTLLLPAFLVCGCQSMNNTDKGLLTGGALGAGAGAIIGSATRHTGAGALIGGALGAAAGGLTGNAIDQSERKTQAQLAAVAAEQQAQPPLGMTDIVNMAQQHISDSVIITQIRTTQSVYHLSPTDIQWLKSNGVSDTVVIEMQATATRVPKRVYAQQPVYIVEPPPPPVIGVGFGYSRCRRW